MPQIWKSPEYRFRVALPSNHGQPSRLREIVIDVTLSAPPFDKPSTAMAEVLRKCTREYTGKDAAILDFGTGKLRNTLYLLSKGFSVWAVEYERLIKTKAAAKAFAAAKRYKRFRSLIYPHQFIKSQAKFDLALLINVLNIMPISAERALVLQECYRKLNDGAYLLWYTQYGDSYYRRECTDDVRLGDGYYLGKKRKLKTFYREFSAAEADGMLLANGFEFVKSYTVPHNLVRLYRKSAINPLNHIVSRSDLNRAIPNDPTIKATVTPRVVDRGPDALEVRPDPPSLTTESSMAAGLKKIKVGTKYASKYHKLAKAIIEFLFVPSRLRNLTMEEKIFQGRKRIDIHATTGKEGFFSTLRPQYNIPAPYISIECKNYAKDLANPEFDQLKGRFSDKKGMFGILVCRHIDDRAAVVAHCKDASEANHYILVLDDKDLNRLLELRAAGDLERIDEFLHERLKEILL